MRGIAILLVVLYHAGLPIPGGFLGVDVFFVISGYVIAAGLLRRLETDGSFSLRDFYARRVRRLLPALGVLLVAVCLASVLLLSPLGPQQQTAKLAAFGALWIANLAAYQLPTGYFEGGTDGYPLIHIWSLSVEEQFYLVFPIVVLLVWKWRKSLRAVRVALWVGTLASAAFLLCLVAGVVRPVNGDLQSFAFYASPTRAWEFGVGALLAAYAVGSRARPSAGVGRALSVIAGLTLAGCAFFITSSDVHPGPLTAIPVLAAALLIWSRGSWLESKPLVWCGDLSYSWYLWHWPFISFTASLFSGGFVALSVAALASLGPAWLSYRYVENRFRARPTEAATQRSTNGPADTSTKPDGHKRARSPWLRKSPQLAATSVAVTLVSALALLSGARMNWGMSSLDQFITQTDPLPLAYRLACTAGVGPLDLVETDCHINADATGTPVLLVGDSNAAMYSDGLAEAVVATNHPLLMSAVNSCPLIAAPMRSVGFDTERCTNYVQQTMEDLLSLPPSIIITAAAGNQLVNPNFELADPSGADYSADPATKAARFSDELQASLTQLVAAGHRVILMQLIPQFPDTGTDYWRPTDCPAATLFVGPESCAPSDPLSVIDGQQAPVIDAINAAAAASGVELVDFRQELCPDGMCSAYQNGDWLYRDGNHLSNVGSVSLTSHLEALL